MEAVGIIAEYNPLHLGHLWHLQETKKALGLPVIAVISGSFMQRGEPAFASKWLRARMAVDHGVDVVFELPTAFSLRSAEFFAQGGVKLLQATGIVAKLSCGAEDADLDYSSLATQILAPAAQEEIQTLLKQGQPYAKACELVLKTDSSCLNKPNNILALEYAKALLNTNIKQTIIARRGSGYNNTTLTELASATAIRSAYAQNEPWQKAMPSAAVQLITQHPTEIAWDEQKLWLLLAYRLRTSPPAKIASATTASEGLENLLAKAANAAGLAEAVSLCTNKRYPSSRIRRLLMQLLLAKPKCYFEQLEPAYLRVLAFSETGRKLLGEIKKKAALPLLTKLGRNPFDHQSTAFRQQLELDIAASDILGLLRPAPQPIGSDYLTSPYYLRS